MAGLSRVATVFSMLFLLASVSCAGRRILGPDDWEELSGLPAPPTQPDQGPGGKDYLHAEVGVIDESGEEDGFTIFFPDQPKPASASIVVFNHGLSQINPRMYGGWIRHLVRKGHTVVYPRYQEGFTPEEFNDNAAKGIRDAIDRLRAVGPQPLLNRFAIIGHSYGGTISANLTVEPNDYDLPEVKALMVAQGYNGFDMRLSSYAGIAAHTKLLIVVGAHDFIVGKRFGKRLMKQAVKLTDKNLVTHRPDKRLLSWVTAGHDEPLSLDRDPEFDNGKLTALILISLPLTKTDVVDYYCYWKLSEALLDCAFDGTNCHYAFGDTPEQRFMGRWSDGRPVRELRVRLP